MKALSLTQPWATLIAIGAKKIETRSWRAPGGVMALAIHAAKGLGPVGGERGLREQCGVEPFCTVLTKALEQHTNEYWRGEGFLKKMVDHPFMPRGAIVAVVRLVRCEPTIGSAICLPKPDSNEYAFGNYASGRFMWMFDDIVPLQKPVPCSGHQSVWDVEQREGPEVAAAVRLQIQGTRIEPYLNYRNLK
ncbi:MAG TPA: hypothetical protein VF735_08945 [Pyrinomonadaceae bacterium]|jgi:hypothetical protein